MDCKTRIDRLAYSLKYMHMLEERPEGFEDEFQTMLYRAGELAGMSQEQRQQYDKAMTNKLDLYIQQQEARETGLAEGRAAGLAEGRAEGRAAGLAEGRAEGASAERERIAKRLRELGLSEEIIANAI